MGQARTKEEMQRKFEENLSKRLAENLKHPDNLKDLYLFLKEMFGLDVPVVAHEQNNNSLWVREGMRQVVNFIHSLWKRAENKKTKILT